MKYVLIISFMWPGQSANNQGAIYPDEASCKKDLSKIELKVSPGAESEWGAFKGCFPLNTYKVKQKHDAIEYPGVR